MAGRKESMTNQSVEIEVLVEKMDAYKSMQGTQEIYNRSGSAGQAEVLTHIQHMVEKQDYELPQNYPIWHRGLFGIVEKALKKISKKIVSWYLFVFAKKQQEFNSAATGAMEAMRRWDNELEERMHVLQDYCAPLKEQIKEQSALLEKQKEALEKQKEVQEEMDVRFQAAQSEILKLRGQMDEILKTEVMLPIREDDFWDKRTRAQSGEDAIILYIFMVLGIDLTRERYLDLGANHAKELSNTYLLYEKGMRGVLVEANPGLIGELKFYRSEDVVLNRCVTAKEETEPLKFYVLNGDGLSCTDLESVNRALEINPNLKLEEEILVEPISVQKILETYFDKGPLVLNVDVEGMEYDILEAIDYSVYAPFLIIVERIEYSLSISCEKREDGLDSFLRDKGYFEYAFTGINSIYLNKKMIERYQK